VVVPLIDKKAGQSAGDRKDRPLTLILYCFYATLIGKNYQEVQYMTNSIFSSVLSNSKALLN